VSAHRRLLEAVLDLDRDAYHRLYATNAEFHNAVATMVRVLPPLMRLIADDAMRNDQQRDLAQALLTEALYVDTGDERDPDWMKGVADSLRFPPEA
jgi:hypothetical protein